MRDEWFTDFKSVLNYTLAFLLETYLFFVLMLMFVKAPTKRQC